MNNNELDLEKLNLDRIDQIPDNYDPFFNKGKIDLALKEQEAIMNKRSTTGYNMHEAPRQEVQQPANDVDGDIEEIDINQPIEDNVRYYNPGP